MKNIKSILSFLILSFFCLVVIGCKSKEERAMEAFEKAMDEGMREYKKTMESFNDIYKKLSISDMVKIDYIDMRIPEKAIIKFKNKI